MLRLPKQHVPTLNLPPLNSVHHATNVWARPILFSAINARTTNVPWLWHQYIPGFNQSPCRVLRFTTNVRARPILFSTINKRATDVLWLRRQHVPDPRLAPLNGMHHATNMRARPILFGAITEPAEDMPWLPTWPTPAYNCPPPVHKLPANSASHWVSRFSHARGREGASQRLGLRLRGEHPNQC